MFWAVRTRFICLAFRGICKQEVDRAGAPVSWLPYMGVSQNRGPELVGFFWFPSSKQQSGSTILRSGYVLPSRFID